MIDKHLILFTAVLACSSSLGAATVVPDAIYQIGMTFSPNGNASNAVGQSWSAAGNYALDSITAVVSGANATQVGTNEILPGPSIQMSSGDYGSGYAQVSYFFSVTAAPDKLPIPDGTTIPMIIFGNLSATASTGSSFSLLAVRTSLESAEVEDPFSGFLKVNYLSGDQYGGGNIVIGAGVNGPSSAFADPFIEVDPSFANASDLQVIVSAGIGNSQDSPSATPEPVSFALAGIGLVGVALIRRRKAGMKTTRVK
jgi:hypothetical protein